MEVLRLVVSKRNIECIKNSCIDIIGDNTDYEANFVFDSEWIGKIKTARFVNPKTNRYKDVILVNDKCTIPVEMLKKGFLNVGVFTNEMTTKPCEVLVRESIKEKTGVVQPPKEDVYAQIIELLNSKQNTLVESGARVGQFARVVEVDENGKPTRWDTSNGGSGEASTWADIIGKPFNSLGDNIESIDGVLHVKTTNEVEEDNTLPITSAGVHTLAGNIESLLSAL